MIAAFAVLFYLLFFRPNVGIPAYSSEQVVLEVSLELIEKYGESMDETEFRVRQYIVISLAYIMVIGLCLAMITFGLSSCARNYISAMAFQIPAVIFSIVISLTLMPHFAEITQNIVLLYMVLFICIFIAVIGNIIRFLSIKFYGKF